MDELRLGRRVVVVGDSGSGKSTVGEALARHLETELIELDALYWLPGWTHVAGEVFRERVRAATSARRWVLVGNYERRQSDISWPRADCFVWLDLPLRITIPRILWRAFARWRDGERVWGDNVETLWKHLALWDQERSLVAYTVARHWSRRRALVAALAERALAGVVSHRLRSPREIQRFLEAL